jgi:cytidine deaminase
VEDIELIALARKARQQAYAPYSHYDVGAALLTASGQVYTGCNVENASYSVSICAERAAAVKAVSSGDREFVNIAVVTADGGTPCGVCRQVLAEFGAHMRVVVADLAGSYKAYRLDELLPDAFVLVHA